MEGSTVPASPASIPSGGPNRRWRWFQGLAGTGFAIVAVAALMVSLNTSTKILVTRPFKEWLAYFLVELAAHMFIGVAILLGVVWARNRFSTRGRLQYLIAFVAVTLAAAAALLLIEAWATGGTFGYEDPDWNLWQFLLGLGSELLRYLFVGLVITSTWLYVRTEADHAAALEQCAIDSARMDQQTAEARLQMLEAQIEPHFLFNTLANVKRLFETDRPTGARMLGNLQAYLAVALPQMRATESTLGHEVDHAKAYLNIQQIRMGRRLAFGVDVPDALLDVGMPPLMLLTLVENAIKHGLNPLPEGGRIDIRASAEGGRLRVQVADTGQGFVKAGGAGTGLANIRARLASQFGAAASLSLMLNSPSGIVAIIVLPRQDAGVARSDA